MTFPLLNKKYKFIKFGGPTYIVMFTKYFPEIEFYDYIWSCEEFFAHTMIKASSPWDKAGLELAKERFTLLGRLPIEDDPEYKEMFI